MAASDYIPALIALGGIPLATGLSFLVSTHQRKQQIHREDRLRKEQLTREDLLNQVRYQDWVSQRWWERKAETYSQIVEALWQLMNYAGQAEDNLLGSLEGRTSSSPSSGSSYAESLAAIEKMADIGAFVISEKAVEALSRYFQAVSRIPDDDPIEEAGLHYKESKLCLSEVREAALNDLGVNSVIKMGAP